MNRSLALVAFTGLSLVAGCAPALSEEGEGRRSSGSNLEGEDYEALYTANLDEVESAIDSADLALAPNGPVTASHSSGGLRPATLRLQGWSSRLPLCVAYRMFTNETPTYFMMGANAEAATGIITGGVGAEVVWDMWHEQVGLFAYGSVGATVDVALGGNIYVGFGTGGQTKTSVADAWSGFDAGGSVELQLPFDFVSGSATKSVSLPDFSITNYTGSLGIGVGAWPFPVNASISVNGWFPWDAGMEKAQYVLGNFAAYDRVGTYLQFRGDSHTRRATEMAKSLFFIPVGYGDPSGVTSGLAARTSLGSYMIARGIVLDHPWLCN